MVVRPLLVVIFSLIALDVGNAGKRNAAIPVIPIRSFSTAILTNDLIVAAANPDSLFERVLSLDTFEFGEPPEGITGGYYEVPNPFRIAREDSSGLRLDLDLEQSYYGSPINVKSDLLKFWAFGLLSIMASSDAVVGTVQWRATIRGHGFEPISVIGEGACMGKPRSLSRRAAMKVANKRALYVLAYRMTEAMYAANSAPLKKNRTNDDQWAFQSKVDSW